MRLLALAGVVSNCTCSLEPLLISVGRVSETVIIRAAATITYLALIYPLLVETGLIGASIAACAYAVTGAVMLGLRGCRVISATSACDKRIGFLFSHHARHQVLRSEAHTSELQSLMRISSAVICLKNK